MDSFFGAPDTVMRLFYVHTEALQTSLQDRLESIAGFDELKKPCKASALLELLISSDRPDRQFELEAADFEFIHEPQSSSESGGCGFIGEALITRLFGDGVKSRRMTEIQVRVV